MKSATIFFDCELTSMGASVEPRLISIGAIHENGDSTFYAELADTWTPQDCTVFVRDTVLPLLEGGSAIATLAETGARLSRWIAAFGGAVQLMTDSVRSDGPWLGDLFEQCGYPSNLARVARAIAFDSEDAQEDYLRAVERAFEGGLRRHHSLDVARANRQAWQAVHGAGGAAV